MKAKSRSSVHSKHEVVYWWGVVDPYMSARFSALHRSGNIDFECWYSDWREPGRSWVVEESELDYPHRFLRSWQLRGHRIGLPISEWKDHGSDLMISFHGIPEVMLSRIQGMIPRRKLAYYVEITYDTWQRRSLPKEMLKKRLLGSADAILSPGADADGYVRSYSEAPIYRLQHAIDVEHFRSALIIRESVQGSDLKTSLGLKGFVFLYVGRMIDQKGIPTLISAFASLEADACNASLLLVGDGSALDDYKHMVQRLGLRRVVFHDFVQQSALPAYYAVADAFVFPTRGDPYGLVVDEAMAAGLPVIASHSAGEIRERVVPSRTGSLFETDSVSDLAARLRWFVENPAAADEMGILAQDSMATNTMDRWVAQMELAIHRILGDSR